MMYILNIKSNRSCQPKSIIFLLICLICCFSSSSSSSSSPSSPPPSSSSFNLYNSKCEPIIGECYDQPYRFTSKSVLNDNSFQTQKAADAKIKSFEKVIACSNYLKLFLCGTYKPSCYEEAALIMQPCKSMCEHVHKRCGPLMLKLDMKWYEELNCSKFLEDSTQSCISDQGYRKDTPMSLKQLRKQTNFLYDRIVVNGGAFDQQQHHHHLLSSFSVANAALASQNVEENKKLTRRKNGAHISLLKKKMNSNKRKNKDDENDNEKDDDDIDDSDNESRNRHIQSQFGMPLNENDPKRSQEEKASLFGAENEIEMKTTTTTTTTTTTREDEEESTTMPSSNDSTSSTSIDSNKSMLSTTTTTTIQTSNTVMADETVISSSKKSFWTESSSFANDLLVGENGKKSFINSIRHRQEFSTPKDELNEEDLNKNYNYHTTNVNLNNKYVCYNQHLQEESFESMLTRNLSKLFVSSSSSSSILHANLNAATNQRRNPNQFNDFALLFNNDKCVLKCDTDVWFKTSEKNLTTIFLFFCSLVCLVTSLITLLNSATETDQYFYPKFAFILQSFCLIFYSLIHLVSIYIGKQSVICNQKEINQIQSFQNINGLTHPILISKSYYTTLDDAFGNKNCLITFSFIYFFRMAALAWWFVFVLSWFLILNYDINMSKLHKRLSKYFHLLAWLLPTCKLLIVLVSHDVDTSELTGLCSVGNGDPEALLKFYIIPTCSYLFIGFILILVGFNRLLFRIKRTILNNNYNKQTRRTFPSSLSSSSPPSPNNRALKSSQIKFKTAITNLNGSKHQTSVREVGEDGNNSNEMRRKKMRKLFYSHFFQMGIIAFICLLTAAIVLGCELYEYFYMKNWTRLPTYFDLNSWPSSNLNREHNVIMSNHHQFLNRSDNLVVENNNNNNVNLNNRRRHLKNVMNIQPNYNYYHRFQKPAVSTSAYNNNNNNNNDNKAATIDGSDNENNANVPLLWIFLLKHAMTFSNGLIIAAWTLTHKFFSKESLNNNNYSNSSNGGLSLSVIGKLNGNKHLSSTKNIKHGQKQLIIDKNGIINQNHHQIRFDKHRNLVVLNSGSSSGNILNEEDFEPLQPPLPPQISSHKAIRNGFKILTVKTSGDDDDSQCSSSFLSDTETILNNNNEIDYNNKRKSYCFNYPQQQQRQQQNQREQQQQQPFQFRRERHIVMPIAKMPNMYSNPKTSTSSNDSNQQQQQYQLSTTAISGHSSSSTTALTNHINSCTDSSCFTCSHCSCQIRTNQQRLKLMSSSNRIKSVSSNSINIVKPNQNNDDDDDERSLIVTQEQHYANFDCASKKSASSLKRSSSSLINNNNNNNSQPHHHNHHHHHYCTPNVTLNSNLPVCCASQIEKSLKQQQQQHQQHQQRKLSTTIQSSSSSSSNVCHNNNNNSSNLTNSNKVANCNEAFASFASINQQQQNTSIHEEEQQEREEKKNNTNYHGNQLLFASKIKESRKSNRFSNMPLEV